VRVSKAGKQHAFFHRQVVRHRRLKTVEQAAHAVPVLLRYGGFGGCGHIVAGAVIATQKSRIVLIGLPRAC
jgi:hypothetical protein